MSNKSIMSDGYFRIRGGKINPIATIFGKSNECSPMERELLAGFYDTLAPFLRLHRQQSVCRLPSVVNPPFETGTM